jgi:Uma2 family endonuclease
METEKPSIRRFTADEAIRLAELGILGEDEHVELLDGVLVEVSPQGPGHSAAVRLLARLLRGAYSAGFEVFEEKPLAIAAHDLPEPDLAVVRSRADGYVQSHPTGRDAILVVEIAWSSQRLDAGKASTYAAGGVEVYWLLDLAARRLEVRTLPVDGAYQVARVLAEDEVVELPEAQPAVRWTVRDLLV